MPASPLSPLDEIARALNALDPEQLDHWYGPDSEPSEVAAQILDRAQRQGPGRTLAELPDWAIVQLSGLGIAVREVTHFIASRDGHTIAAAVNGKPVHLTRR